LCEREESRDIAEDESYGYSTSKVLGVGKKSRAEEVTLGLLLNGSLNGPRLDKESC
jgi:hypothetical protein